MASDAKLRIVLVGGGLGGALLATYLGRAGHEVDLYERRADPGAGNFVGGRSINLAISARGIDALQRVGLADEVLKNAIPMRGRMIHDLRGGLHFQPYDQDPRRCINSIGRAALNHVTINAARAMPNVRVHFNQRCTEVDLDRPAAQLVHAETGITSEAASDLVIGVDGAFSAVRRSMQRLERFQYSQTYLEHGYKELAIPPDAAGAFQMEPNALHIWPRRSFMMIALPNPDGSFTCTLFRQFEGPESFATLRTPEEVRRFFERQFPDAVPMMPTLTDDFFRNPTGSMVTIRCSPWRHRDKVVLLGDAAHAVVPFYGQGANASFEDVVVFSECLEARRGNVAAALAEYDARRRPNADAIADLALANFIEMRDHTGSRAFRAKKALERTLHKLLPGWFTPLYTLVSFTLTPYAEAVRIARVQGRTIAGAAALLGVLLVMLLLVGLTDSGWKLSLTTAVLLVGVAGAIWNWRHERQKCELRRIGVRGL